MDSLMDGDTRFFHCINNLEAFIGFLRESNVFPIIRAFDEGAFWIGTILAHITNRTRVIDNDELICIRDEGYSTRFKLLWEILPNVLVVGNLPPTSKK